MDIGITSLATYLNERTDHKAGIIDLTFHRKSWKEELRKEIGEKKPDIIGISCNTMYMQYVKAIMAEVKSNYRLPVILGGHHVSIYPGETIALPEVDAVCIGDGEDALCEFLDRLSAGKSISGIAGIWAKEDRKIIKNAVGCFRQNIDDLPIPNWDLWKDLDKYFYHLGMLYIIGSRGCPYKCTFCDAHGIAEVVRGRYFRNRDPVKYAQEIGYQWEKYKNRDLRLFQLFDPVFTMSHDWVAAFCDEYRRQGLHKKIKFSVFSRIDHLDAQKIKILAQSGCGIVRVGVEAGDEFIRQEIYQKRVSDEDIRKIFRLLHDARICITAYYILGGPSESPGTLQKTIDLALELDAGRSAFFIYKPLTKEGVKQVYDLGGWIDGYRWGKADNITFDAVINNKELTPKQVEWYQFKAYFFTFVRRLLRILKRQKLRYLIYLIVYLYRGFKYGLSLPYMVIYYHIYGYDNIDK
ncbi:MAG: radical SAM protein [Candidatus Omnitrophica bacterium]|nr:radical SAM protein [Candidatus Omnitrophota bacterium]